MLSLSIRCFPGLFARSRRLFFCGFFLGGTLPAWGQLPAPPAAVPMPSPRRHSLSLEAQSVSNGGHSKTSGGVGGVSGGPNVYGGQSISDTRVSKNKQLVEFTVRNFDAAPDTATVDWYFIAAPVSNSPSNREFVFDRGSQNITVPGTGVQTQTVSSQEAEAVYQRSTTITQYTGNGASVGGTSIAHTNSQHGTTLRGWFVRLIVDGRVVATRGSSQKYEDLAADEARSKELIGAAAPGGPPSFVPPVNRSLPGQSPAGPLIPGFPGSPR